MRLSSDYKNYLDELTPKDRIRFDKKLEELEKLATQLKKPIKIKSVIHMLKGLPASGKSTIALQMVNDAGMKRVNKDLLREMLHGGKYTPELERFVLDARNAIIKLALQKGYDVVIDDTNLNPVHQEAMRNLSDALGANLEVIDVDTPLEECIQRDQAREKPVGEDVIRRMYEQYLEKI